MIWAANASFSSISSMSFIIMPAIFSTLWVAYSGLMPIRDGSKPAKATALIMPSGRKPSARARSALMITAAAAPSVIGDEFPAVTVPERLSK